MNEALLHVEGLKTELHGSGRPVRAVDGIDLEIRKGETFALVGESGSGKSMTALSIMRLLPETGRITAGKVALGGSDLLALPEAAMRMVRGRRVAMIFQEPATSLNPVLAVGYQIREVLERHTSLKGEKLAARTIELIESVGIPDAARRLEEYPFQLSGGLKQRVMIAMALAAGPDLLIADEPTTALDVTIQAQILDLLRALQRDTGMSILLITHDLGIVAQMAQRVAVMYAGHIVEVADREAFFAAPQHPYSRKLFASLPGSAKRGGELSVIKGQVPPLTAEFRQCRFAERCDYAFARCHAEVPAWTRTSDMQRVRCHLREEQGPAGPIGKEEGTLAATPPRGGDAKPLLSVRGLKVHFPIRKGILRRTVGYVKAVDGVSFEIAAGRTLALVGESGCGKTTVGKAILQLIRPSAGEVAFDGVELTKLAGGQLRARRNDFQIIFQDPYASLNPRMRVADILAEGMSALGVESGPEARSRRVDELLEQVGLAHDSRDRYPHEFSGGQRQRIAIARALAVRPRLIVCDEPTSALDVSVQAQILNLLKRLQAELGLSYLFITHNIAVVEYLAHEVSVMYLGRIVEHGTAEAVLTEPLHPYTKALLSAVPVIDGERKREVIKLHGDLPSPAHPPAGCHFQPRCPQAQPQCAERYPDAVELPGAARSRACSTRGPAEAVLPTSMSPVAFLRKSLQWKIVFFFVLLLTGVQGVTLLVVDAASSRSARASIKDELAVGERIFRRQLEQNGRSLMLGAEILSLDFALREAVATRDLETIRSALANHGSRIQAHIMMLVSLERTVIADTRRPESAGQPFIFPGLIERAEKTGRASGTALVDGRLSSSSWSPCSRRRRSPGPLSASWSIWPCERPAEPHPRCKSRSSAAEPTARGACSLRPWCPLCRKYCPGGSAAAPGVEAALCR
jgi:peptide/nickel transport system ATP-binding protein